MNIVRKIEKLLEEKKMSKYELTKRSGVSSSTITYLMSGKIKNPTIDLLTKVADALCVNVSFLLDDKNKEGKFNGENLKLLRANRTYEEYANYLKEKGGTAGIYIDPYFLMRYEKGKDIPAFEIIDYIADMENVDVNYFYQDISKSLIDIIQKGKKDDFNFMDEDVKEWVKDPKNYSLLLLAYNTYKKLKEE